MFPFFMMSVSADGVTDAYVHYKIENILTFEIKPGKCWFSSF